MVDMTAFARILITLQMVLALGSAAQAHPHMFFKSTAQFILDEQGKLSKLRVVFLVDELNTTYTFAELGVNKDGDQTLTPAEKAKIAENVSEGFGFYKYFTFLRDKDNVIALGKPLGVIVQLQQLRLGLSFTIPLKKPLDLKGRSLSLQLYDPTYFTAITIGLVPTIVGKAVPCSVTVKKPTENERTRRSQVLLSQLSREETPEESDVGAVFAETTRLVCRK